MGTWGTAIFSDDFAADIKGEFSNKIGFGKTPEDATKELISEYSDELTDPDISGLFWLALAATQWTLGRLQESVKRKAIEIIESGQDLERWAENEIDHKKRQAVLEKLKQQLQNEQPNQKKLAIPFIRETKMETGDLLTYRHSSGKMVILRVLDIKQDPCGDRYPQIEILDHFESILPKTKSIKKLKRKMKKLNLENTSVKMIKSSGTYYVAPYGKRDIEPWDKLEKLDRTTKSPSDFKGTVSMTWWREFDPFLDELFENK